MSNCPHVMVERRNLSHTIWSIKCRLLGQADSTDSRPCGYRFIEAFSKTSQKAGKPEKRKGWVVCLIDQYHYGTATVSASNSISGNIRGMLPANSPPKLANRLFGCALSDFLYRKR